ncbi:MAG: hypothetical protein GF350_04800 [Chitinivibrionales bacterium]|nr:hypothetical protein [Chitinivibrionales bacterium]
MEHEAMNNRKSYYAYNPKFMFYPETESFKSVSTLKKEIDKRMSKKYGKSK